jgi:hypothetical protein
VDVSVAATTDVPHLTIILQLSSQNETFRVNGYTGMKGRRS